MIMRFLLVTVLFLEIFVKYNGQVSGEFACEDGEEYNTCPSPCEKTCDNIRRGIESNCFGRCTPGCFCRRGLVRADDNSCVPPSECFRPICQENEEYLDCGSPCTLNCTNFNSPIFCTKPCHRGCFCKPNFVRDTRGKCIEPRNCRLDGNVQCPTNEEYVNCLNFCNTCFVTEYCRTPYCTPGCDCKSGYFRNTYGQCVTEEQCLAEEYDLQQQCGLNEVYTSCVNPCNDCYSRGRCDNYLLNYCTPGCDCKPGYYRSENGMCVPEWNCFRQSQPVCPPGEEHYDCIPTCRVTCDTYNTADVICDTTCNRGCFCKRGFIRNKDGFCVSPSECPARPLPCPSGETFYQCLPTCRTTCRTLNAPRGICSTECKQGCFCQPGFVRNDDGVCVPPSECPFVCRPNEDFRTCGSACPATCENFRNREICPQQQCFRGCFCKAGFVLGPKGDCIQPRNCPVYTPVPCCNGLRGRSGNGTNDEEDISPVTNITNAPTITEIPLNASSDAPVSTATKSSLTREKVPDETITPKSEAATTSKSAVATTVFKSAVATTVSKSATTATFKSAVTTTASNPAIATTFNSTVATTIPKSTAAATNSELSADTTSEMTKMTTAESKIEPTNLTTNITETPTTNATEGQTSNTELSKLSELSESTTVNSTPKT